MKVAVIFGPPGVGKGTQCSLLSERKGVIHISTGSILREEVKLQTELGKQVESVLARGDLVSDDLLFSSLLSYIQRLDLSKDGWLLLDGVPRNVGQVEKLNSIITEKELNIDMVVSLEADTDELINRFAKRWTCNKCGFIGSFTSISEAHDAVCVKCNATSSFERRKDDEAESVKYRMSVYHEKTAPVKKVLSAKTRIFEVNGVRDIEVIYSDIAVLFN